MLIVALLGCAGSGDQSLAGGKRVLVAKQPETRLLPFQSGDVQFVLRSGTLPIGGQMVSFSIIDQGTAKGATLASSSGVSDAMGVAKVVVRAGMETQFKVHATSRTAEADAVVLVAQGDVGSVSAVAFWGPSSLNRARARTGKIRLYDGAACSSIPPDYGREEGSFEANGGSWRFDTVQTDQSSAVVAQVVDSHGSPVASGCVDVPGSSLLPGDVVEVGVRLDDIIPDPVGSFAVMSVIDLIPSPAAAATLAAAWRDLADCPLDPAQLWLDCTIDALSPASPTDPLDCVPSPTPGGETALGDVLLARRGVLISDLAGGASACRGSLDASRAVSLDALVLGLYGSPLPTAVAALPAVANDAAHILDRLSLSSILDVRAGVAPSSFSLTHVLESATFGATGGGSAVTLAPLGLPVLEARATAAIRDGQLAIDPQGFTLRLGTTAKAAFAVLALETRGLPGNVAGLVGKITADAHSADGTATGCAALDGAVCAQVGRPAGCLSAACTAGLDALAARLGGAFDAADGSGLDLMLSGVAPLLDHRGKGFADRLGSFGDDSQAARWSVDLRTSAGRTTVSGRFEGSRRQIP